MNLRLDSSLSEGELSSMLAFARFLIPLVASDAEILLILLSVITFGVYLMNRCDV